MIFFSQFCAFTWTDQPGDHTSFTKIDRHKGYCLFYWDRQTSLASFAETNRHLGQCSFTETYRGHPSFTKLNRGHASFTEYVKH